MDLKKKQPANSILGLAFDGSRMEAVVLRRTNGSVQVAASINVTLSLDPLTNDVELVGQEIKNHLEAAEIRERRCVVCLPLSWALTLRTMIPDLPEEDIANLLQIEAERGFPYSPDSLVISSSIARLAGNEWIAMQVAAQRDHVLRLEAVLKAARLTSVSFSLGLPALQGIESDKADSAMALTISDQSVGIQVTAGGGLVALRALDNATEAEGAENRVLTDIIARELRITLGQIPASVRDGIRTLRVFGAGELVEVACRDLQPRLQQMGLTIARCAKPSADAFGLKFPPEANATPALALAARYLAGSQSQPELMAPKISAWRQFTDRYSSRKLAYAGTVAAVLLLLVIIAFGIQQVQLAGLRSQWAGMSAKVLEVDELQKQIRQYRPWFDESFRTMTILKRLSEAFPEDGSVTAKLIEFRDSAGVSCAGTAQDNKALMKATDKLGTMREITDLQVDQLRGRSPVQFTFKFHWGSNNQP